MASVLTICPFNFNFKMSSSYLSLSLSLFLSLLPPPPYPATSPCRPLHNTSSTALHSFAENTSHQPPTCEWNGHSQNLAPLLFYHSITHSLTYSLTRTQIVHTFSLLTLSLPPSLHFLLPSLPPLASPQYQMPPTLSPNFTCFWRTVPPPLLNTYARCVAPAQMTPCPTSSSEWPVLERPSCVALHRCAIVCVCCINMCVGGGWL